MSARNFNYQATLGAMAQKQATALDALYYQEAPAMLALSLSVLQRRIEAEEVLRESFILLWKNAAGYDPTLGDARAWVYSILRFRLQARAKAKAPDKQAVMASLPDINPSPQHHLVLAIGELEPVQQRAIILAYLQGTSYDKLSQLLGRPSAELRIQVQQGLQQVAQQCLRSANKLDQRQSTLIAEYALGLLSSSELAQAHHLMHSSDDAATVSLEWEKALLELLDFLPSISPTPTGLAHIYRSLDLGVPRKRELSKDSPSSISKEAERQTQTTPATPDTPKQTSTLRTTAEHTIGDISVQSDSLGTDHKPISIMQEDVPPSYSSLLRTDQSPTSNTPEPSQQGIPSATESKGWGSGRISRLRQRRRGAIAQNTLTSEPDPSEPNTQDMPEQANLARDNTTRQLPPMLWPSLSAALLLLSLLFAYQWYKESRIPNVTVIEMQPIQGAILQAPGSSSSPAWSVTVDPQGNVLFIPQVQTETQAGQSVQLWTQIAGQGSSRSLGLIDPNRPITVPAALIGNLENGQIFEMTLEQAGGSDTGQPKGPVLYIGSLVNFGKLPATNTSNAPIQRS